MKTRVYIAGPLDTGRTSANVRAAIDAWMLLADAGFAPYCPHLTHFIDLCCPQDGDALWMEQDLEWLSACHALLLLPGPPMGPDSNRRREVDHATELGFPVFTDEPTLLRTLPRETGGPKVAPRQPSGYPTAVGRSILGVRNFGRHVGVSLDDGNTLEIGIGSTGLHINLCEPSGATRRIA